MNKIRPIEEIREESTFQEIFKLMDMLNQNGITYEFYDHSCTMPYPIFKPFSFEVEYYEERKRERYQIIIRKHNSEDRLISIIELDGYNDTLEIMSNYIYVHDETAVGNDVEQYLSAEDVFKAILKYYMIGGSK